MKEKTNYQPLFLRAAMLLFLKVTAATAWAGSLSGSGTVVDPFLISSDADWETFATNVNNGESYSGKTLKLTADINVSKMAGNGSTNKAFKGTFDGGGHTITVNLLAENEHAEGTSLFGLIDGATIHRVCVKGTITTSDYIFFPATIASYASGSNIIRSCWSDVDIESTSDIYIYGAAFVGQVFGNASVNLIDCLFTGSIVYSNEGYCSGGMVGSPYTTSTVTLSNCLFAPRALEFQPDDDNSYMFVSGPERASLTNCYYNAVAAASVLIKEGIDGSNMSNEDLCTALGNGWEMNNGKVVPIMSSINLAPLTGFQHVYSSSDAPINISYTVYDVNGHELTEGTDYTAVITDCYGETVTGSITASGYYFLTIIGMNLYTGVIKERFIVDSSLQTDESGAYLINNALDWESLVYDISVGKSYSGEKLKLTSDISVTAMAGMEGHPFSGTLDGQGHTLTVDLSDDYHKSQGLALFYVIENAVILNTKVAGTIVTAGYYPATIASYANGNSTIFNCWSATDIIATAENEHINAAALVSNVNFDATLNVRDCLFSGTVTYGDKSNEGAGMVGLSWRTSIINVWNSLYSPSVIAIATFDKGSSIYGFYRINNSYYNDVAAASVLIKTGTDASGMTNEALAAALGSSWEVNGDMVVPKMNGFAITSINDWNQLAAQVSGGSNSSIDRTVIMTADIGTSEHPVTTGLGTAEHPFVGYFDGFKHTLYVGISSSEPASAPFGYISGSTILNLNVAGSVTSSGHHAAGMVGICSGANTIEHCGVSTDISGGAAYAGGIVGHGGSGQLTMKECFYSGTISGVTNHAGGLLGWCESLTLNMKKCLMKGSFSGSGKYHPIACKNDASAVDAFIADALYLNTISITETGNNLIPGGVVTAVSKTSDSEWKTAIKAADGNVYYAQRYPLQILPYTYGFETTDMELDGWKLDNWSDSRVISLYGFEIQAHSGDSVLFFENSFMDFREQRLISPEITTESAVELSFYYSSATGRFNVGYSTTTNDIDAFIWNTYKEEINKDYSWVLFKRQFPKGTKYVAIKWLDEYKNSDVYIDDISIVATAYTPPPANLAVDATEHSATFHWDTPDGELPVIGYVYQFKSHDDTWASATEVQLPAATTSATFNNLELNTDYDFRVKAIYESNEDVTESIFALHQFMTAVPLPFFCGFEHDDFKGWKRVDGKEIPRYRDFMKLSSDFKYNGDNSFAIISYPDEVTWRLISPRFSSDKKLKVSFYYKEYHPTSGFWETFQVGYSTTTNDLDAFTWSDDYYAVDAPWTLYENVFPAGTRFIAIKYKSYCTCGLLVDDFRVEEYSPYAEPVNLVLKDQTDTQAMLEWGKPKNATGFAYQYKKCSDETWSAEATLSANTPAVTLSNLEANTKYDFRVKALYNNNADASTYAMQGFCTDIPVVSLPYAESFENGLGGWRLVDRITSRGLYKKYSDYIHSGKYSFEISGSSVLLTPEYLMSPPLDGTAPFTVSFYYKHNRVNFDGIYVSLKSKFQVGYSTKTRNPDDFVWGNETITETDWQQYVMDCPAGTRYVAVRWVYGYSLFMDDFNFMAPATIHFAKEGYGTFYSSQYDLVLHEDMKAYIISQDNDKIYYICAADGLAKTDPDHANIPLYTVPAGTPVLLNIPATASPTVRTLELIGHDNLTDFSDMNLLQGSDVMTTTTGNGLHYKLSYGQTGTAYENLLGWYWGAADGAPFTSAGHKAWFVRPTSTSAPEFLGLPNADNTTSLRENGIVRSDEYTPAAEWYTLDGRRLAAKPTNKGIYVNNGRKVVIK